MRNFFALKPPPHKVWEEHRHRDVLRIRIEPQLHEIVIDPASISFDGVMSPQQAMEYEIVNRLRDVAQEAAHLVIQGGLEAVTGQKQDPERTRDLVTWAVEQKEVELEAAANRIAELEKTVAEQKIEIAALERVLRK